MGSSTYLRVKVGLSLEMVGHADVVVVNCARPGSADGGNKQIEDWIFIRTQS